LAIARDQALSAFFRAPRPVKRLTQGHVNESWLVDDAGRRFVVQRISRRAFRDPVIAARNFDRVSRSLRSRDVRTVRARATRAGEPWFVDADGEVWRSYHYAEGRVARPRSSHGWRDVATAFGAFARALAAFDEPIEPAIARFHDIGHRVKKLEQAATRDRAGRARRIGRDLDRARGLVSAVRDLDEFVLWRRQPARTVHNDAKPSNLVIHAGQRPCVIDLDTVGPGTLANDVGELVRSSIPDESGAPVDVERVVAIWDGFAQGWRPDLEPEERVVVPIAGIVLATELACRYLADHLDGDRYFTLGRGVTTLDRARSQMGRAAAQLAALGELRRRADDLLSTRS
jgi:Ser/Thr protein kinase RdoA (MazF antagonist)